MSQLPARPLSQEDQQRLMEQLYFLLGAQVKSYHKYHRMGNHSSVPVELAQDFMASMEYTIGLTGGLASVQDAQQALQRGQVLLEEKVLQAKQLLQLVCSTAPQWQTECRWDAQQYLRGYLEHYDHLHLAHKGPDDIFYPILIPEPDGIQGIDRCLFLLNILWIENQIMACFDDEVLEQLWSLLPMETLNQCEHVILNGIGKIILSPILTDLLFTADERHTLKKILSTQPIEETLRHAAVHLSRSLDLPDKASVLLNAAVVQLIPRIKVAVTFDHLSAIFL